ncbi:hypothetical protein [Caulobacter endophyticus]|uniref:hypothetical protein n=1 Tax=Caulobacter endophyticus TaxID=2172652 RepID=UPI002410855A|nr:hypothetical protein [Caulobacter endophyticus]MDG2530104.1 hypothetical protein [Caulobacter endophyticus]
MIEACERCGKRIPGPRLDSVCETCEIVGAWPWGFVKWGLLALTAGAIVTFLLR